MALSKKARTERNIRIIQERINAGKPIKAAIEGVDDVTMSMAVEWINEKKINLSFVKDNKEKIDKNNIILVKNLLDQGSTLTETLRISGVSLQAFNRWRKERKIIFEPKLGRPRGT